MFKVTRMARSCLRWLRGLGILASVALVAGLSGCDRQAVLEKLSTPEQRAAARHYIDALRDGRVEEIEAAADASLRTPDLHTKLLQLAALIPKEAPKSVKLVGTQVFKENEETRRNIVFEYEFPSTWMLMRVSTREKAGQSTIIGMHVNSEKASYDTLTQFSLAGKSPGQYVVLALVGILPLLTLYALILCVVTRLPRRKWLWVLFILVGFGSVSVNWNTGLWRGNVLSFQLFSASATAEAGGPWVFDVSIPLGAILFLIRRRSLMAEAEKADLPAAQT
ncbi:MAG TPA: hypothetical protein VGM84_27050 [Steroidobacteraceae bacterium]